MAEQQSERVYEPVRELAARLKAKGEKTVVVIVGIPGAGKSRLAQKLCEVAAFTTLNADSIRVDVTNNARDESQDHIVWPNLASRFKEATSRGESCLLDNMNHIPAHRSVFVKMARDAGYDVILVFMDVSLERCLENNRARDRNVDELFIRQSHRELFLEGQPLADEPAIWVTPSQTADEYMVSFRNPHCDAAL